MLKYRLEKKDWREATRHLEGLRVIELDWEEFLKGEDDALEEFISFIASTLYDAQEDGVRYVVFAHGPDRRPEVAVTSVSVTRLWVTDTPSISKLIKRASCRVFEEAVLAEIRVPAKRKSRRDTAPRKPVARPDRGSSAQFKIQVGHWRFAAARFPDAVHFHLDPTFLPHDDYNWIYSWEAIVVDMVIAARTAGAGAAILVHGNPALPPDTISLRTIVRDIMRDDCAAPHLHLGDCLVCDDAFIAAIRPVSVPHNTG